MRSAWKQRAHHIAAKREFNHILSVEAMFWRMAILAVGAGLLFGVDLASIGAAVESMSKELQLDKKQTEWVVSCAKGGER